MYTYLNTDHDDDKNIGMANKASKRRPSLSSFFFNFPNHSFIFHISTFETLLSLAGFTLYLSNYLAKCDKGKISVDLHKGKISEEREERR